MRINEIFTGIDGEVNFMGQGTPSLFIRMQGCNMDPPCPYCDTPKSLNPKSGTEMTIREIKRHWLDIPEPRPKITITGGEPLFQEDELHELLNALFPYSVKVSIETNGTLSLDRFRNVRKPNKDICLVVDLKLDQERKETTFRYLRDWDWVKMVIQNKSDFNVARGNLLWLRKIGCEARFALSPAMGGDFAPAQLWEWMKADGLFDVVLNVQLHRIIGLP